MTMELLEERRLPSMAWRDYAALVPTLGGEVVVDRRDDRGSIRITREAPNVLVTRLAGYCSLELAHAHVEVASAAYARGARVRHFFDFEDLTGYDSAARIELTQFAIANRAHVEEACFLVRSRLVAMGVRTAALAARLVGMHFEVISSRAELDAAIDRAVGATGRRPASMRPRDS